MPPSLDCADMKNSGIEWIADIPSHWNVRTLYQLVSQVKNKNSDLAEQNLLSLSYGKIKRKDINSNDGLLPASFDGYNIVEAGDIVLRLTDLQNDHTSLRVGLVTERGIITSAYVTLRPSDIRYSKYLYYLLHAFDIKKGFYGMGAGVRQGLTYGEVRELRLIIPSGNEVENIVSFLDAQCFNIDEVIVETQASIDEYRKWRTSIIYEAVTKGLDPNMEMNDSKVELIGKFPKKWTIRRLRFLCSIMTGDQDTQNAVPDGKYPFYVRSPIVERANAYTFNGEAVLMAGDGAGAGKIFHHVCGKFAIHQRVYCLFDFRDILPQYLFYFMCNRFSVEMEKGSAKSTVPSVRLPMLQNFAVSLPEIIMQKRICDYLNERINTIDLFIAEKQVLITDLEAYKQSLIYEVITGKRKVV